LTREGVLTAQITEFFNLEKGFTEYDLISLLFYMGWITIKDIDEGRHRFVIPNRVIQELLLILVGREWHLIEEIPIVRD
jgi:hypothetical protein